MPWSHLLTTPLATLIAIGITLLVIIGLFVLLAALLYKQRRLLNHSRAQQQQIEQLAIKRDAAHEWLVQQQQHHDRQAGQLQQNQLNQLTTLQTSVQQGLTQASQLIRETLAQHHQHLNEKMGALTQQTARQLTDISKDVNQQLAVSFDKTNTTFQQVIERLGLIDQAQRKITELSGQVVGLQDILTDKRSRGAFGEVQLNHLIANMIPKQHFSLQHTLSNGKRPDCLLLLPKPVGSIAIDAKFPLENYRLMRELPATSHDYQQAKQQFKLDIRRHISAIGEKYILEPETASGALMFIPAEAIFAEIHAEHPDLVSLSQRAKVWLVSPTTLMAVLTTVRAVLKDHATQKQVHVIQNHLNALSQDFARFEKRMAQLARHVGQANDDVAQIHQSSKKITGRFQKIEQVDITLNEVDKVDKLEQLS